MIFSHYIYILNGEHEFSIISDSKTYNYQELSSKSKLLARVSSFPELKLKEGFTYFFIFKKFHITLIEPSLRMPGMHTQHYVFDGHFAPMTYVQLLLSHHYNLRFKG